MMEGSLKGNLPKQNFRSISFIGLTASASQWRVGKHKPWYDSPYAIAKPPPYKF